MLIGYARVSEINQQDIRAQVEALKEAGCKRISKRVLLAVDGIGFNSTVRWTESGKAMFSWSGSWTDDPGP